MAIISLTMVVVSLIMSIIEMFEMCMGIGELEVIEVPLNCRGSIIGPLLTITKVPTILHALLQTTAERTLLYMSEYACAPVERG